MGVEGCLEPATLDWEWKTGVNKRAPPDWFGVEGRLGLDWVGVEGCLGPATFDWVGIEGV